MFLGIPQCGKVCTVAFFTCYFASSCSLDIILRSPGLRQSLVRCLPRLRSTRNLSMDTRSRVNLRDIISRIFTDFPREHGPRLRRSWRRLKSTRNCILTARRLQELLPFYALCLVRRWIHAHASASISVVSGPRFHVPPSSGSHLFGVCGA